MQFPEPRGIFGGQIMPLDLLSPQLLVRNNTDTRILGRHDRGYDC